MLKPKSWVVWPKLYLLKTQEIRFLVQLYHASRNILYMIISLDSMLGGIQESPTLKQIISLEIGLICIISDNKQGRILHELRTWALNVLHLFGCSISSLESPYW